MKSFARTAFGNDRGYAMAALLVGMSIMALAMSVALPTWNTFARREREAELIFRGEQYARAISLFQRKYANTLPPNLDVLLSERFLRKKYLDPITNGEFQLLSGSTGQATTPGGPGTQARTGGQGPGGAGLGAPGRGLPAGTIPGGPGTASGGITGVTSRSPDKSLRLYNGRGAYNEWTFVAVQRTTGVGGPGTQAPGRGAGPGSTLPGTGRGPGAPPSGGADGGRRGTGGLTPPPFGVPRRGGGF